MDAPWRHLQTFSRASPDNRGERHHPLAHLGAHPPLVLDRSDQPGSNPLLQVVIHTPTVDRPYTDRTGRQIRKLVNSWSSRGSIEPIGKAEGKPDANGTPISVRLFRFGDIGYRLAQASSRRSVVRNA